MPTSCFSLSLSLSPLQSVVVCECHFWGTRKAQARMWSLWRFFYFGPRLQLGASAFVLRFPVSTLNFCASNRGWRQDKIKSDVRVVCLVKGDACVARGRPLYLSFVCANLVFYRVCFFVARSGGIAAGTQRVRCRARGRGLKSNAHCPGCPTCEPSRAFVGREPPALPLLRVEIAYLYFKLVCVLHG